MNDLNRVPSTKNDIQPSEVVEFYSLYSIEGFWCKTSVSTLFIQNLFKFTSQVKIEIYFFNLIYFCCNLEILVVQNNIVVAKYIGEVPSFHFH